MPATDLKSRLVIAATAALGLAGCSSGDEEAPEQMGAPIEEEAPAPGPSGGVAPTRPAQSQTAIEAEGRMDEDEEPIAADGEGAGEAGDDDGEADPDEDGVELPGSPDTERVRRRPRRAAPRGAGTRSSQHEVICGASCGADCSGEAGDEAD